MSMSMILLSPLLPRSAAAVCNMYIHELIHIKKASGTPARKLELTKNA